MIVKTRGIVLHQYKYTDSGLIVHYYTRDHGRQSLIMKGIRNKRAGRHNTLFQPLSIHEMEIYYRESRDIQVIKEVTPGFSPSGIYSDIMKTCSAIFLGEVLASVLKEESPNGELFNYLEESVVFFDSCNSGPANFHIAFLAGLTGFLGFKPSQGADRRLEYFDMLNGIFTRLPPGHGHYTGPVVSGLLASFFTSGFDIIDKINLTGAIRNEVLEALVVYYSLHLPGLKKIRSLEILKEVFN
jgi:DNA repair protein RecO (recombination protein O)